MFSTPLIAVFDAFRIVAAVACIAIVATTPYAFLRLGVDWKRRAIFAGVAMVCVAIIAGQLALLGTEPVSFFRTSFITVGSSLIAVGITILLLSGAGLEPAVPEPRVVDQLANIPAVIVIADAESRILQVSGNADDVIGWNPRTLTGAPLVAIIPERFVETHLAGIDRFRESGAVNIAGRVMDVAVKAQNGEERPIKLVVLPLPHAEPGKQLRVLGILRSAEMPV